MRTSNQSAPNMLTLFESQFVGGDEERPAKLFDFLD
jgi:hypothetical protein